MSRNKIIEIAMKSTLTSLSMRPYQSHIDRLLREYSACG